MYATTKHSQLKKTPAGESGLLERVPLHSPGTVNTDPAGASYMTYQEQLKSPKWQKKRLEVMQFYGFCCQVCDNEDTTLNVHHIIYHKNKSIWDYDMSEYSVMCQTCHEAWHFKMNEITRQLFYLRTNCKGFTLKDFEQIITYFEFMPEKKYNKLLKDAENYKYPWI